MPIARGRRPDAVGRARECREKPAAAATERPNILWIVVDDMSADFGCYGSKAVPTPHVDRLAVEGTRFAQQAASSFRTATAPATVALPPYLPADPVLAADRAAYLDAVRLTAAHVGRVIARLEAEGILDETLVIFMTDHGISHVRAKQFLYDEGTHVPFIVRGPGIPRGEVREDLVEHIDVPAISLAAAGLPIPPTMQGRNAFATGYAPREAVFAARDRCNETVDRMRSVRTPDWLYIRNFHPGRPLLQPDASKDAKPTLAILAMAFGTNRACVIVGRLHESPERERRDTGFLGETGSAWKAGSGFDPESPGSRRGLVWRGQPPCRTGFPWMAAANTWRAALASPEPNRLTCASTHAAVDWAQ